MFGGVPQVSSRQAGKVHTDTSIQYSRQPWILKPTRLGHWKACWTAQRPGLEAGGQAGLQGLGRGKAAAVVEEAAEHGYYAGACGGWLVAGGEQAAQRDEATAVDIATMRAIVVWGSTGRSHGGGEQGGEGAVGVEDAI